VEHQLAEPEAHYVEVRIDHPGHDSPAAAILTVIGARRVLAAAIGRDDPALLVDRHRGEACDRAVAVDRDAVDVVDQRVGKKRGGAERQECSEDEFHAGTWRRGAAPMAAAVCRQFWRLRRRNDLAAPPPLCVTGSFLLLRVSASPNEPPVHFAASGRCRTSALVSWRPPPSAWTSA